MLFKKVLIFNLCCHKTSEELCSIIGSNFNCDIQVAEERSEFLNLVNQGDPDLFFLIGDEATAADLGGAMGKLSGVLKILVLCTESRQKPVINHFLRQFDDFMTTPFIEAEVVYRVRRCLGEWHIDEKEVAKKNILNRLGVSTLIGQDPVFLEAISIIPLIADCDATILLSGETGVGKEVCARAIHYLSHRSAKPFIPVNCAAIPTSLVENELFGHRRGAFTDAQSNQLGVIAEAAGGTLFLDEIDVLTLEGQSKLLRLLQDKTYRPLGQTKDIQADIRVIVATNVDLRMKVQESLFRADLFYRLSVVNLPLPALRQRKSDIPVFAKHFFTKYCKEYSRGEKSLSATSVQKLLLYDWPGNIRELENIIQQTILLTTDSVIQPNNINLPISIQAGNFADSSFSEAKKIAIEAFERQFISQLLISCEGNITRAAKKANKHRGDLSKIVKKYKFDLQSFHPAHS